MSLSELEATSSVTDYRLRKYLKGLISYKKEIDEELKNEDLPIKRRIDLEASKEIIEQNIQRIRFSGVL